MYIYIYIYIYIYTGKTIQKEIHYTEASLKGYPLYRDIPKGKSLVKGSLAKNPYKLEPFMKEIHYKEQSITYKRNHLYMGIPYKKESVNTGNLCQGDPLIREIFSTCTDEGRPRIYPGYYYY